MRMLPCKWLFTCCKILRPEVSGLTSSQKEGVLQTFITLKNPRPQQGLNPQTLGPIGSTLTIIPLRQQCHQMLVLCQEGYQH
jgi:hypothetical protein